MGILNLFKSLQERKKISFVESVNKTFDKPIFMEKVRQTIIHDRELANQIVDSCSKPISKEAKEANKRKVDSVSVLFEKQTSKIDLLEKKINDMLSMIDGAYEIVELWGYHSEYPSQKEWAKNWLEKARKYGAQPE